jgi:hypothetical protein
MKALFRDVRCRKSTLALSSLHLWRDAASSVVGAVREPSLAVGCNQEGRLTSRPYGNVNLL